jgi:hypothetical protein
VIEGERSGHDIGPDLTTLDFLLLGFVKDDVHFPPLSANVDELREKIAGAFAEVTPNNLHPTWE